MNKPPRNLDVEDLIIEHSMALMIDVMEELEANTVLGREERTMLSAYTRVLRRRLVDYLCSGDGPEFWTMELVENCGICFEAMDDSVKPIIAAHCKYMTAVDALQDGDPIPGASWRRARRTFNHLVDSFREYTDKAWPFLETYSPKVNETALAS